MASDMTPSGIPAVGDLRWGDHFCQFYETADDLRDTLVPYFRAGLESNEKCLWVTSAPFDAADATAALRAAVPDVDRALASGQIEIIDYRDWYLRNNELTPEAVLQGWLERANAARSDGYRGLRLTGNTAWLEKCDWAGFEHYEATVDAGFRGRPLVALCSYQLSRCEASWVTDVVRTHQFAVIRRRGVWEMLESGELKLAKQELSRLNADLEKRVEARTAALERAVGELRAALAEKEMLFREVHHRVKNNLQIIASLLSIRARTARAPEVADTLHELRHRVHAMGLVHQALYKPNAAVVDFGAYLDELCRDLAHAYDLSERVHITIDADTTAVALESAVPLGLITTELVTNAVKHAFPNGRRGRIKVQFRCHPRLYLRVHDDGVGLPEDHGEGGTGFGIVRAIAMQLGAELSILRDEGTAFLIEGSAPICGHGAQAHVEA
jgi:two-component system, sensor histidine kinase PdtaS